MDNFAFLFAVFVVPLSCGVAGFMAGYDLSKNQCNKRN